MRNFIDTPKKWCVLSLLLGLFFRTFILANIRKTLGKLIICFGFMGTWGLLPWSSSCCSMDILPCVHMCLMERIDTSCSTCCRILCMGSCVKLLSIDMHMPLRILIKTSNTPTKIYQKSKSRYQQVSSNFFFPYPII